MTEMPHAMFQATHRKFWSPALASWAARDLMRQPAFTLVLFVALAAVTALTALVLLLQQTLATASTRLLDQAPHVVVRRVGAGGWLPLDAETARTRAGAVVGVLRPRARVWGVVSGPEGAVTLVAVDGRDHIGLPSGLPLPQPGQALAGPGVSGDEVQDHISLNGSVSRVLTVIGQLPSSAGSVVHDVVVAHAEDVRALLGLGSGQASDLALDVFHPDEASALLPELAAAFDWPVQITTRQEQLGRHLAHISRATGMACLGIGPLLLAILSVVVAVGIWGRRNWETGVLRAVGWTGADMLRLHLYRGLLVGLPAMAIGTLIAHLLLFWPGMTWVPELLFGWSGPPPGLYLSSAGSAGAWLLSMALVGVPFMAAVFWTGWRAAGADPGDILEGGR